MTLFHKAVASGLGIGLVGRGGGSLAAGVVCVVWYYSGAVHNILAATASVVLVAAIGVWSSDRVEKIWGHDSPRVVVDEIAGMGISLVGLPAGIKYVVTAFLLFRFFDIVKPLGIRQLEKLNGGLGVMLDDVVAGLYANLLIQVLIALNWY